jgi:hypothetical protein
MRNPASIRPWLTPNEMAAWVRDAPTKADYQKRLVIWFAATAPHPAHQVADWLQISRQTVWLWVDATTMSLFLSHVAAAYPQEYGIMVLDGASWHHAAQLRVPPTLRLLYLPPYSPELNPMEHVWDHLRENHMANRVFDSLEAVVEALSAAFATSGTSPTNFGPSLASTGSIIYV